MTKILNLMRSFFCVLILCSSSSTLGGRYMENLGRGVVTVRTGSGAFISWRLLALDPADIGFNLYRSTAGQTAVKVNVSVLTGGTNYTDTAANFSLDNTYYVKPVIGGVERDASGAYTLKANTPVEPCIVVPLSGGNTDQIHFVWVGDLDGDGEYDYVVDRLNWVGRSQSLEAYHRDGTRLWSIDLGPNSTDTYNIEPGSATIDVGHWDGVTVYDLDNDGKSEVIIRTANGVTFGDGSTLTAGNNNYQFISVVEGMTGAERARIQIPTDYIADGPLGAQLGIGYLNGETPSIIASMKNRIGSGAFNMMICAWDFDGSSLTQKWKWLRPWNCPDGHNIRIVDVDGDGMDEVGHIGFMLNSDGTLLYSLGDIGGVVHGDRWHIGKFDQNRPGLQGYGIQQDNPRGMHQYYYDAATGEFLWSSGNSIADLARGDAADIDPRYAGFECWTFDGVWNGPSGTQIATTQPWPVLRFLWDGDDLSESYNDGKIEQWNYTAGSVDRQVSTWNYETATGSDRGAPMFYGDILGDWREEAVMTSSDYTKLVIFTTDIPTTRRLYTLPQNPAYRNCMTVKGYMQSHQLDYYLGAGMATPPVPDIILAGTPAVYGDFNEDRWVDMDDLCYFVESLWLGDFWSDGTCTLSAELDLDDDCAINTVEYAAMVGNWTGPDTVAPSAPGGLSAFAGNGTVSLDWFNNSEQDFDSYYVYRSTTSGSGYTQLAADLADSEYVDSTVTNGLTYYYVVTAVDINGNESDYSVESSARPVTPILVAHYELDGNSNDSSPNGNHAVATGAPVYTTGYTGQAVDLDGSDDYLTLPGDVANSNDITVAAWVHWDGGGSWQRIFDFGNNTTEYMFLTPSSGDGTLRFAITTSGNGAEQVVETSELATGQWVHVAVTLEGNTGTLYVNGLSAASNFVTLDPPDFAPVNNYIGQSQWPDPLFDGRIEDFRIYNYALSASDIRDLGTDGDIYEAESALYGGEALLENNHAGFMGTGFINFPTSGGYLEFTDVDGGAGGNASLDIRYALGATEARTGNLIVNGVSQSITFDPTGDWTTWTVKNLTVPLNSGTSNTIRFESNGQDLANIDEIIIVSPS